MDCEFCHRTFSNKYTLKTHQTTSKQCNGNKEDSPFKCEFCQKNESSKARLVHHLTKCKDRTKSIIDEKDAKILELENKIKALEESPERYLISELQLKVKFLEQQLQSKEEHIQTILSLVKPTAIKTTVSTLNTSIDYINETVVPFINLNIVKGGHKRIIKCIAENFLIGDDGVLKYRCTDASRRMFVYSTTSGETIKDKKCSKLAELLLKTDIVKCCMSILKEKGNDALYNLFIENGEAGAIARLFRDEIVLATELTKWLC